MLKIKDDVDLKELERFGFKPKYSEDTGELNEYFFVNRVETELPIRCGINIKKEETKSKKIKIRHVFKRDKYGCPNIKENKVWIIDNYNYYFTDFDILYDLIKADLVEKV
jgi:hypothetical protein